MPQIVTFLVIAVGLLIAIRSVWLNRKKVQILASRPELKPSGIIAQQYGEMSVDLALIERFWSDCARALGVSPGRLRPADRFRAELAPADVIGSFNDPRDSVAKIARQFADERGQVIDLSATQTLDELMRAVIECERHSRQGKAS